MLRRVPGALKGSFDYYRGIDCSIPQYRSHAERGLNLPVLAFAGELACGDMVQRELHKIASDVRSVIYEDGGHYNRGMDASIPQYRAASGCRYCPLQQNMDAATW
ncbi:hypothetical protein ABKV83_21970 (plasmid) [Enterobacter asburiae]|uniref:hypothetical protein n=1 Tax=Enterobacter asburiae TaxID=61645 RepID=UPI0032AFC8C2